LLFALAVELGALGAGAALVSLLPPSLFEGVEDAEVAVGVLLSTVTWLPLRLSVI
jgi:hypothetical protein